MAKVKVVVTGLRKIDRKLAQLPYKVQGKVVRPAIRAGMKVMAAGLKAEVPVDTGLTRKMVKVRATPKSKIKKGNRSTTISMETYIAADGGLKKTSKGGKTVFYPAIVEYGSRNHAPNPFGHRAFSKYGNSARRTTVDLLKDGVNREIKSL
jgi:HK97 gp10 family phage protein